MDLKVNRSCKIILNGTYGGKRKKGMNRQAHSL